MAITVSGSVSECAGARDWFRRSVVSTKASADNPTMAAKDRKPRRASGASHEHAEGIARSMVARAHPTFAVDSYQNW